MYKAQIMAVQIFSVLALISAISAITFRQRGQKRWYYIFKPVTTVFVMVIGGLVYYTCESTYALIMLGSFVFALAGDILLMNDKTFRQGILAFMIAQVGFALGFMSLYGFNLSLPVLIVLLVLNGSFYVYIKKELKTFATIIAVYMLVITFMNWQAIGLALNHTAPVFTVIAAASLLFTFSDAVIAYNKFKKPLKIAGILILSTYWIAIYVFVMAGLYVP